MSGLSDGFQGGLIRLCVLGMLLGASKAQAQYGNGTASMGSSELPALYPSLPLGIQPRTLKLGMENPTAGQYLLDSLSRAAVYVPAACVGKQRCPLVVLFHGGLSNGESEVRVWRPIADRYGMLLYAPSAGGAWWSVGQAENDRQNVERGLQQVLERFAVDTSKMALIGSSAGGGPSMSFGGSRLDLFGHVALLSTDFSIANIDPRNTTTQFLLSEGLIEGVRDVFMQGRALREAGHPVEEVIGLHAHGAARENLDVVGRWLHEGWTAAPNEWRAPVVVTEAVPILTLEDVKKLGAFWQRYVAEPESLRLRARESYKRQVLLPFATNHPALRASLTALDIPALAAKYPSVAADLAAAGLMAEEEERLLVAFVGAIIARTASTSPGDVGHLADLAPFLPELDRLEAGGKTPMPADSVLAKSRDMSLAHVSEFNKVMKLLVDPAVWGQPGEPD